MTHLSDWGSQRDREELDRHITGNYGEDQFSDEITEGSAVTVRDRPGVAWRVVGFETRPDADTEWSGIEEETGPRLLCRMVGDDRITSFEPEELIPLSEEDFCPECGQTGCGHYRSE